MSEIKSNTFEIEKDHEVVGNDTYLYLTCIYNGDIPTNQTIIPFELVFDASENAVANDILTVEILEDAILAYNGKEFVVNSINIEEGNTVILALYYNDYFMEMQSAVYKGENIVFNTDKNYTDAKIMVWEQLSNVQPITVPEVVN